MSLFQVVICKTNVPLEISDRVLGRSIAVVPRSIAPRGYVDLEDDDKSGTILGQLSARIRDSGTYEITVS